MGESGIKIEAAFFLSAFAQEDRVEELIELLPKVLPVMNSDKGTASAFQCLGRHGKHQAAMKCLTSLKKSGTSFSLLVNLLKSLSVLNCSRLKAHLNFRLFL